MILKDDTLYPVLISKSAQPLKLLKRFNIIEAALANCISVKLGSGGIICFAPQLTEAAEEKFYIPAWMI